MLQAMKAGALALLFFCLLSNAEAKAAKPSANNLDLVPKGNFSIRRIPREKTWFDSRTVSELPAQPLTLHQRIFHREFNKRQQEEFDSAVKNNDQIVNDPIWHAKFWQRARLDLSRKELAKWTVKESFSWQLREFIYRGGDRQSAPIRAVVAMHMLTGGEKPDETPRSEPTEQQRNVMAHRVDLRNDTNALQVRAEENGIPTRFVGRFNVLTQSGSLHLRNRLSTATLSGTIEDTLFDFEKQFQNGRLRTKLIYGFQREALILSLVQKLTTFLDLDITHTHFTGTKRGPDGEDYLQNIVLNYVRPL